MRGVPGYVEYDFLCHKYICWQHIRLFMLQFHPLAPKIPRALPSLNLPILFWFFVLGGVLGGLSDWFNPFSYEFESCIFQAEISWMRFLLHTYYTFSSIPSRETSYLVIAFSFGSSPFFFFVKVLDTQGKEIWDSYVALTQKAINQS